MADVLIGRCAQAFAEVHVNIIRQGHWNCFCPNNCANSPESGEQCRADGQNALDLTLRMWNALWVFFLIAACKAPVRNPSWLLMHFCNVHMDCSMFRSCLAFFVFEPIARWSSLFSLGEVITWSMKMLLSINHWNSKQHVSESIP